MSPVNESAPELPTAAWEELETIIRRFEECWRQGRPADLADFLPPRPLQRLAVLVELAHVDLEWRLKSGLQARAEDYLSRFPELAAEPEVVRRLVQAEQALRLRLEHDRPGDGAGRANLPAGPGYDFLAPPEGPDELGRLGPYRLLGVLGAGGMGVVFRAEDVRLARPVALKVIKPEAANRPGARQRFLREARAAAALEHENIVPVYAVDEAGGVPYLAMPLLRGQSLEERLRHSPILPVAEVVWLGKQVARGLAAAHEKGLIHRDIKPANLWLEAGSDRVKVLDFGLAHVDSDAGLTQTGTVLGTPAYMAPEQARGAKVSPRSDLFSLGVVLYRLCTGHLPFRGTGTMAVLTALAVDDPVPAGQFNPALPPDLAALVMQMLNKEPGKRPASAAEVAGRLEAIERQPAAPAEPSQTEVLSPPARPPGEARAPARRMAWKRIGLAAAAALAVLLPVGYFLGSRALREKTSEIVERPDEARAKKEGDADRRAAEWVLSLGGHMTIRLDGQERGLGPGERLPAGRFQIETILLSGTRLNDAGLANLEGLAHLKQLDLGVTPVSDAGLARLKGLNSLESINLHGCARVSDTGLAHLKELTSLTELGLMSTPVSDAGLAHLEGLARLKVLNLQGTQVSDSGLSYLKGLNTLESLTLNRCDQVSDAGLAHLKGLTRLKSLLLSYLPKVSDAGLVHLEGLAHLETLDLTLTKVGDAGLAHLAGLTQLRELGLNSTKVSDAGLVHLKGLTRLTRLNLQGTPIRGSGLSSLAGLPALKHLYLFGPAFSADFVQRLAGLKHLETLFLGGDGIGDRELEKLHGMTGLRELHLLGTRVSPAGLAAARKALPKCRIQGR